MVAHGTRQGEDSLLANLRRWIRDGKTCEDGDDRVFNELVKVSIREREFVR